VIIRHLFRSGNDCIVHIPDRISDGFDLTHIEWEIFPPARTTSRNGQRKCTRTRSCLNWRLWRAAPAGPVAWSRWRREFVYGETAKGWRAIHDSNRANLASVLSRTPLLRPQHRMHAVNLAVSGTVVRRNEANVEEPRVRRLRCAQIQASQALTQCEPLAARLWRKRPHWRPRKARK
jgi:hypothetical protein